MCRWCTCPAPTRLRPASRPCLFPPPPLAHHVNIFPVHSGVYLHGCNMQPPTSTQVPNILEVSPTMYEGLPTFQFGGSPPSPPPHTRFFLPNRSIILLNWARFKLLLQCRLLCYITTWIFWDPRLLCASNMVPLLFTPPCSSNSC